MVEKSGLRNIVFSVVMIALILILSVTLGVVVITHEPDQTDMFYSVDDSGNGDNEIHVTSGGISYMYTGDYQFITNDRKSHAKRDMTIYRPVAPEGWYILGDYCQPSYDNPSIPGIIVRVDNDGSRGYPLLAPPKDWELVWADHGSRATRDTSIWKPVPPWGYVGIGMVAVQGYSKPVIPEYRCVLDDRRLIDLAGNQAVWSTDGSPAYSAVTIYAVDWRTTGPQVVDTNTFTAYSPYFPGNVLATRCLKA